MNIISAKDIKADHITTLIYGAPGMGKTTLLGNLKGHTLIVDVDKGTSVLAGCEDVDVVRLTKGMDELRQIINELKGKCDYDNVCIDSLSELEGAMLSELGRKGRNNGVPELGDYNRVDCFLIDWCRMAREIDANIFFTAWEKYTDITAPSGEKITAVRPMLRDKNIERLCGLCDLVGRVEVSRDDGKRIVWLEGSPRKLAKDRIYKRQWCKFEEIIPCSIKEGERN